MLRAFQPLALDRRLIFPYVFLNVILIHKLRKLVHNSVLLLSLPFIVPIMKANYSQHIARHTIVNLLTRRLQIRKPTHLKRLFNIRNGM